MSEKRFIKGVWINEHEFSNGDYLLNVDFVQDEFSSEFKELVDDGRLRLTFKKSKSGKWYAEQNTFKPAKTEASQGGAISGEIIEPETDMPF
tara:strand:- start:46 stop:321 length:276 start_codon:yes stop_codon:yes gene_type:complete